MRHQPIKPELFIGNRRRLIEQLQANAIVVVNNNDILPTNADGTLMLRPNSDFFYLTGIEQEETILLLYPDSHEEKFKEILFIRESSELTKIWEGHKLSKEEAKKISGIERVEWTSEFDNIFHRLMAECDRVYLNSNEHKRASIRVETREARFARECIAKYPLHEYHRLAKVMHRLRAKKSPAEIELLRKAGAITREGFLRVAKFVKPGVNEMEVEAEFAHEFIRRGGNFAYTPIIASGANSCVLHYIENNAVCKGGDLLLLDVASSYANYNADLTRTIPVKGRFTKRQKQIYKAVLRVLNASAKLLRPEVLLKDWQKQSEALMENELLSLGLITKEEVRKQNPDKPALKKYFMHGIGHPLGLDVHDVGITSEPLAPGWVLTCEPGIYIVEEGIGIRLENDYLVTEGAAENLMDDVPVEPDEIEELMNT